jgi:hypothetical protein
VNSVDLPNAPFYRRWSFILAGVIGLAAITALLGWRGLQQVADPPVTTLPATTVTSPAPTTTPPTSYGPSSKPDEELWSKVGSDVARSPGFRAPYAWRIVWSFDCTNFKQLGGGNFKITGNGAFNQVDIQAVAVEDSGTQRYRGGGFGQLQVDSVCKRWSVKVLAG